jgi:hypothetical protein
MKFQEFIDSRIARPQTWPRNQYVEHKNWESLYVRVTKRPIGGVLYDPVIDLANITAKNPGNGAFRMLVGEIRREWPKATIFVESVLDERFRGGLLRMGFKRIEGEDANFYLPPVSS